jgi:hypothetical protein
VRAMLLTSSFCQGISDLALTCVCLPDLVRQKRPTVAGETELRNQPRNTTRNLVGDLVFS